MSRGLGRIQRECLRIIEAYQEEIGRKPTTFDIIADVYQIKPDRNGDRMFNDAQHVATKRALAGLRRKGLVVGEQDVTVFPDGRRVLTLCRQHADGSYGPHSERCCFWSIVNEGAEEQRKTA